MSALEFLSQIYGTTDCYVTWRDYEYGNFNKYCHIKQLAEIIEQYIQEIIEFISNAVNNIDETKIRKICFKKWEKDYLYI